MNEFEKLFDTYEEVIRKEIEKDTEVGEKLSKVQSLIFVMHEICKERFSQEYLEKSKEFSEKIETYSMGQIKFQPQTKFEYWGVLMEWFALMVSRRWTLVSNMNRVDFGD